MGKVVAAATVSLDGYIAGPNESGFEHLFAWFDGGNHELPSLNPNLHFRLTEPDYRYMRDVVESIGVFIIGRRMFDLSDGWGGRHAFDKPIVVVTHSVPEPWVAAHPDAPFTFVTDGLPAAIERARAIADDRNVCHAGQAREPVPGAGPGRPDLDRPRARAARLWRASLR